MFFFIGTFKLTIRVISEILGRPVFMLQDYFEYNSVQLGINWYNSVQLRTTPFLPVLKPCKTELYRVIPRIIWSINTYFSSYFVSELS